MLEHPASSEISIKTLRDLDGLSFFVPPYQRGYRWRSVQVKDLLEDVNAARSKDASSSYYLQPVVVHAKEQPADAYELIDGQQRLTTLWILQYYLWHRLRDDAEDIELRPKYRLDFETRVENLAFLESLEKMPVPRTLDEENLLNAFMVIKRWFDDWTPGGTTRKKALYDWHDYLSHHVKVIWYRDNQTSGETLFLDLNRGRIQLSNSELIKALLVAHCAIGHKNEEESRQIEITAQWDDMERALHDESLWAFLTGGGEQDAQADKPRLEYLFNLLVPETSGPRKDDDYRTFTHYAEQVRAKDKRFTPVTTSGGAPNSAEGLDEFVMADLWRRDIRANFLRIQEWFENNKLFHKIGFLIAVRNKDQRLTLLRELLALRGLKSAFRKEIDARIRKEVALPSKRKLDDLSYKGDQKLLLKILLLYNVVKCKGPSDRYSFALHHAEQWSLEHINPQSDGFLAGDATRVTKADWFGWLKKHLPYLAVDAVQVAGSTDAWIALGSEVRTAVARGEEALTEEKFKRWWSAILAHFGNEFNDGEELHSLRNLALLSRGHNSSIGNDLFVAKRRAILERAARGEFVPICTLRVFLKHHVDNDESESATSFDFAQHSLAFWTRRDGHAYLADINKELQPYLAADVGATP